MKLWLPASSKNHVGNEIVTLLCLILQAGTGVILAEDTFVSAVDGKHVLAQSLDEVKGTFDCPEIAIDVAILPYVLCTLYKQFSSHLCLTLNF